MAFDISTTLQTIKSHLLASGWFDGGVMVGEPKSPPGNGLTAAVFMERVAVDELTLSTTIESHEVVVRFYTPNLQQTTPNREDRLEKAVAYVEEDLFGDFTLGGTVRNIDISQLEWEFGHVDIDRIDYRTVEATLSLIVDGSATLAA